MTGSLIDRVRERLAAENVALRPTAVAATIRAESGGVLGDSDVLHNIKELQSELSGAGILEPLLCADDTTDVLVTAPDRVWVDDGHGLRLTAVRFTDEAAVRRLAQRLALAVGRRLDDAQPFVDGQLLDVCPPRSVVRLHAVLAPIAAAGTCISLRVLRPMAKGLDQLIADGTVPEDADRLLRGMLAARLAFLVTGGTGAGYVALRQLSRRSVTASGRISLLHCIREVRRST